MPLLKRPSLPLPSKASTKILTDFSRVYGWSALNKAPSSPDFWKNLQMSATEAGPHIDRAGVFADWTMIVSTEMVLGIDPFVRERTTHSSSELLRETAEMRKQTLRRLGIMCRLKGAQDVLI
jgi:hypothetical protein